MSLKTICFIKNGIVTLLLKALLCLFAPFYRVYTPFEKGFEVFFLMINYAFPPRCRIFFVILTDFRNIQCVQITDTFNGWICCYYRWTIQGANKSRNEEVGETDLRPICPSLWACEIGGIHKVIQIEKFVSKSKLIYIRLGINFRFTKTGKYQHWNSNFHL